jgi:hypothetical protein
MYVVTFCAEKHFFILWPWLDIINVWNDRNRAIYMEPHKVVCGLPVIHAPKDGMESLGLNGNPTTVICITLKAWLQKKKDNQGIISNRVGH